MHHLTPEQLAELRESLLRMREKLIKQAGEKIRDPSDVTFEGGDEIDRANIETGRYLSLQRIKTRELKLLRKIDYALMKMEHGTYGVCESCGALIPFERLKARPVTTMCINCKELEEEGEHE
ncbi:MAG: TraR/DksA family transcriptional regulator [Aquificaceae bacterium]|nr:TraR/DksA family transcriptional regulator [Aquificaceae bacterium]MCX8076519.1 TraR/DksA family transcriptional regulator [Aquificaceae bacterium]MDW8096015.1 TraR/DksA C4-type zinc finger protein [Aquificaceae bacterium]